MLCHRWISAVAAWILSVGSDVMGDSAKLIALHLLVRIKGVWVGIAVFPVTTSAILLRLITILIVWPVIIHILAVLVVAIKISVLSANLSIY